VAVLGPPMALLYLLLCIPPGGTASGAVKDHR
jgi:hypothetical protein